MDPLTRARLELLVGWYDSVRRSTLRLLERLSDEELCWQPDAYRNPAQWIFAHLAVCEELRIHRRREKGLLEDRLVRAYRSGISLEASRDCRLAGDELRALLARLTRKTSRFLRRVLDGKEPGFPDLLLQLEKLIFHENQHLGQIHYLRVLREGMPSGKHSAALPPPALPVSSLHRIGPQTASGGIMLRGRLSRRAG